MYDSKIDTLKHIHEVLKLTNIIIKKITDRAVKHDASKLEEPEKGIFDTYTPKLKETTYGSDEYKKYLKEMSIALDHHYANNRHHPEHFKIYVCDKCGRKFKDDVSKCSNCSGKIVSKGDISQMNIIDLIEMFCDWKAATLRHNDGDLNRSIEINKKRFNIDDQLCDIFRNSVNLFDE